MFATAADTPRATERPEGSIWREDENLADVSDRADAPKIWRRDEGVGAAAGRPPQLDLGQKTIWRRREAPPPPPPPLERRREAPPRPPPPLERRREAPPPPPPPPGRVSTAGHANGQVAAPGGEAPRSSDNGIAPSEQASTERTTSTRSWRRSRRPVLQAAIAIVVLVLAADAGFVVWGLASSLRRASEGLEGARSGLAGADMPALRRHSSAALGASLEARKLEGHPSFRVATLLPLLGTEARTLAALSQAAEHGARAGLAGARAGDVIGITPDGLAASLYRDGRVDLDAVARASPFMEAAAQRVGLAAALLRSAPEPALTPLRDALATAREQTTRAEGSAGGAAALFERLPSLLGGESRRRYLLAFQALGEARATGGVMGAYGVLEAADGRLRLTRVGPVADGFPAELANPVNGPPWFERSYGSQHALTQVQQANLSPNFPVAAEVWLRMYRSANGDRLDGVVAMDPLTLAEVMRGTGPIALEGFPGTLTAGSVADSLLLDSYLDFTTEAEQNRYLIEVVRGFWSELRAGDIDSPGAFAEGLGEAVRTKHLKVYSRDVGDRRALGALGLDGDYPAGPNLQLVFNNNYSTNKVDYFLQRRIETTIDLLPTGDARVVTTATLTNAAPSGPRSELLGPGPQAADPPGLNRMFLGFLLPRGAAIGALRTGEQRSSLPSTYADDGFPVVWDLVEIPAGQTARATVEYTIEDAAQLRGDGGRFTWSLEPQTGVTPARFSLRVSPPDGYRVLGQTDSQPFVASGVLDQTRVFRVELEPSG